MLSSWVFLCHSAGGGRQEADPPRDEQGTRPCPSSSRAGTGGTATPQAQPFGNKTVSVQSQKTENTQLSGTENSLFMLDT